MRSSLRLFRKADKLSSFRGMFSSASLFSNTSLKSFKLTSSSSTSSSALKRAFATAATKGKMFCFQCEQTDNSIKTQAPACTTQGVCGKTSDVANLQDLVVHTVKGIAMYLTRAKALGSSYQDIEVNRFILEATFSTLTNVNFDRDRMIDYIRRADKMRDRAKALYLKACQETGKTAENLTGTPAEFKLAKNDSDLEAQGVEQGLPVRKAKAGNDDLFGIIEMTMYGIKGTAAYLEHAMVAGLEDDKIYDGINQVLSKICDPKLSVNEALATALKVGELNLLTMALLDKAHTTKFGHPEPTTVRTHPVAGKAILVSGHDLTDLEKILIQTEGKGINVYTHGEMLPAHSYPGLKKFKHLVGNYGTAWQLQKMEFAAFPGPIVMTSNCIIEPQKSYKNRIFTRRCVGFNGVQHVEGDDFSTVIKSAQSCLGFSSEDAEESKKPLTVGFGRNTVMGVADKVVDGVKSGAIKRFFVIGGCDGTEGERSYFRDIAKATPKDSLILTLGCGKYRFNSLPLGDIGGIPRVLDMGQCNDAFSAISVAAALAGVFKTDVNKLPLSFAISWFEQKAVAVFLTLLHLNMKNIRLGPRLPAFATPNMVKLLVENYGIAPIGDVQTDLKNMMNGQ